MKSALNFFRHSHQEAVDQGDKRRCDGLRKQVLCGVGGLDVHLVRKNHAWKPNMELRRYESNIKCLRPDRYHVQSDGNRARI